jgi:hypothetical protein
MTSLEKNLSIGIITQIEDIHCDKLVKGLVKHSVSIQPT